MGVCDFLWGKRESGEKLLSSFVDLLDSFAHGDWFVVLLNGLKVLYVLFCVLSWVLSKV